MRRHLLNGVAAAAITVAVGGVAVAADMPVRHAVKAPDPALAIFDWSGFYVGGHLGYGRARTSLSGDQTASLSPSGVVGGMHIGQNWQANTFVFGWEADLSATGWSKRAAGIDGGTRAFSSNVNLLASLRGRVGLAFDRSLLYVTGGLAYSHGKGIVDSTDIPREFVASFNRFGGVLGLGAEWKQTQNFSWRLEGLYYYFNKSRSGIVGSPAQAVTINLKDAWVVRIGATHHF
jgi:outer membrane immunogenic protein